jgi:hypothetical protein
MFRKLTVAAAAATIAAGVALAAAPAYAQALWRLHGGGGGGGHAFAPHGFGGGGMRFGPHGGGGSMMHFGGGGFGRFAPHSFGGAPMMRFGGRGFGHFGPQGFSRGSPMRFGGRALGASGLAASHFNATNGFRRFGPGGYAFGGDHAFHHGWSGWQGYRRGYVGWGGPVFWPYAYDDLFGYAFSPYEPDDDLFWSYGYDDLFAGVLLPFLGGGYGYGYGYGGGPAVASHPPSNAQANAQPQSSGAPLTSASQLCVSAESLGGGAAIDPIVKAVNPTPDQNGKLDALKNAEADAQKTLSASCSQQTPMTTVARLDAVQGRVQAMIQAANTVSGPLNDFYASLNDEQKAQFNALGQDKNGATANLAQLCGPNNTVPAIAVDRISSAVKPDDKQRASLNALRDAAGKADDAVLASCPKEAPLTPTGRLDAVKARLQAMANAIDTVKPPLQDFYSSLSDEQKARFDALTQPPSAAEQQHAEAQP